MKIKKVIPSGYCKGVVRAIEIAKKTRKDHPEAKIYVLGMIVHNSFITNALTQYDIITLEDKNKSKEELIDQIDEGIIIFTAHGISDQIKKRVRAKGLHYVDASCSDVIATQNIVKRYLNEGYEVFYVGKKGHPEAEAVLAISEKVHLIASKEDIIKTPKVNKLLVTNQTTMSILDIADIFDAIKERFPKAVFEKEICNATTMRQKAILELTDCDLLYIIGDPQSNNTNKLKELACRQGIPKVRMIESVRDIELTDLKNVENIYVTAGASTPTYLSEQVIETLLDFDKTGILKKPMIDLGRII